MALGEFRGRESSSHAKSCPRLACTSANMFVLPSSGTATAASNCAVAVSIRMAAGAVYSTGVQAMTEQGWNNVQRDVIKITWASPYEKMQEWFAITCSKTQTVRKKRLADKPVWQCPWVECSPRTKLNYAASCSIMKTFWALQIAHFGTDKVLQNSARLWHGSETPPFSYQLEKRNMHGHWITYSVLSVPRVYTYRSCAVVRKTKKDMFCGLQWPQRHTDTHTQQFGG